MSQSVTNNTYDSEFCGNVPIHLINVIQPYGVLLIVEREGLKIQQASENVEKVFHASAQQVVNTPLAEYVTASSLSALTRKFSTGLTEHIPMVWEILGNKYLVIAHSRESFYILEINIDSSDEIEEDTFVDVYQELKYAMSAIENCRTMQQTTDTAAAELKKFSGFDKVMIYQFDEHWNGHVLSEEMERGMESYLDFTFPASDIPRQARDQYLKNAYRFIPDRTYTPVKIYPVINPTSNTFLDLSDCNVRGVASVHLEYLKNMGVAASMSIRILKDGKLWGLIACHHRTAMRNSYKMCSIFELLSNVISSRISSLEKEEQQNTNLFLQHHYSLLVEETYRLNDIRESFFSTDSQLLHAFDATGAMIFYQGEVRAMGEVPPQFQVEDLLMWLHTREIRKVYSTERLEQEHDQAADYAAIASGLLVIPINQSKDEYILLFRKEYIQVIKWGGDPGTRINFEEDMKTYHPRFSFKLWQEQVQGVSRPWKSGELVMAENLRNFLFEFLNANGI
ncbi:MAG TPA: GAF domain-containing protein [Flavitalea sp.]|nr:GAF domain-containing protein [Flavitalea sp.]